MLHYLENLFYALDLGSLGDAAVRMVAVLLCLTVHETCHGLTAVLSGRPNRQVQAQTVPEPPAAHRLVRPSDDVCRRLWLGKTRTGGPQIF